MPKTPKGPITKVVIYRGDEPALTVEVQPGHELQGLVFDKELAKKCPAPHGNWPPPGVHFHSGQTTPTAPKPVLAVADATAVAGMTARVLDAPPPPPPPPPDPPPGCYIVNGEVYCP